VRVRRERDGRYRVRLRGEERALLRRLAEELQGLVAAGDDPSLVRLFPPAYENEDDRAEFERLTRQSLVDGKREAAATLAATAAAERLTQEELEAWLGALNDLRLVLGTRLGVTEDTYDEAPTDPGLALYGWLTWVQGEIVEALAQALEAG
jgi:Lon protease-like protein